MSARSGNSDDDTPLGPTEMQAMRLLAEPAAHRAPPDSEELWASRYRIAELIGQGGMGDVFRAHDILLDRQVALKVLRQTSDESFVDERKLLREARAAARAEHERIARVYDAGTWKGRAFIAMEFVRGKTLRAWMKTYRPTHDEIMAIVQQLLEGLQALHERGLVHRDLKPENVMVTAEGSLRILDLGIARRVAIADTNPGVGDAPGTLSLGFGVGTPGYMAPEQWHLGDVDARADLFALGAIAYELVTTRVPFRGSTNLEVREQTLHGKPSFEDAEWANVPAALQDAIRTALAKDPNERFQNVAGLAKALASLLPPSVPPLSSPPSIRPPGEVKGHHESLAASVIPHSNRRLPRRRPVRLVAASLAGVSVVGIAVVLLRPQPPLKALPPKAPLAAAMVRLSVSYAMGSDQTQLAAMCESYPNGCPPEAANETPLRPATIDPFELDVREVTNQEFAKFLTTIAASTWVVRDKDADYPRFVHYALRAGDDFLLYDLWEPKRGIEVGGTGAFHARAGFEQLPVTLVTWLGAHLFCKSVNKRLPTEAEWEFAARGAEKRPFPWGTAAPTCDGVHIPSDGTLKVENPDRCDNTRVTPFPVMSAPQDVTPDGIYDLAGNVAEWVNDSDAIENDEAIYASRLKSESPGIVRGGAYNSSFLARATSRVFRLPFNPGANLGFRCAKSITP